MIGAPSKCRSLAGAPSRPLEPTFDDTDRLLFAPLSVAQVHCALPTLSFCRVPAPSGRSISATRNAKPIAAKVIDR